ncbi:MAG: hypothetical protein D6748_09775 [Calditrichaeota bacterium]|nr:MAG: hypothetical protein D6748_09775 [Calditrichota bacterium]
MKRIHPLLIILIFLSLGCLYAQDQVAVVIKVRGIVKITPSKSTQSRQVKKGEVLKDGDKLETGAGAYCAIKFLDDKSLLRIKEKSVCVIEGKREEDKIEKNIFVEIGSFFASLFKPKGSFRVTTPTSVASVKGTQFWVVQFGQSGETHVICLDGVVEVKNNAGKVLVGAGQTAIVTSRNRMPTVQLTRDGEIPSDDEDSGGSRTLDIEFQNSNGETKTLRIEVQE